MGMDAVTINSAVMRLLKRVVEGARSVIAVDSLKMDHDGRDDRFGARGCLFAARPCFLLLILVVPYEPEPIRKSG